MWPFKRKQKTNEPQPRWVILQDGNGEFHARCKYLGEDDYAWMMVNIMVTKHTFPNMNQALRAISDCEMALDKETKRYQRKIVKEIY
jgi:uncharacterized protein YfaT (DUF1175 family)